MDCARPRFPLAAPVNASFIAVALDCVMTHDPSVLGRFLNCRPAVFVGALSYSVYVWQQIFPNRYGGRSYNVFPLNVLLAILDRPAVLSHGGETVPEVEEPDVERQQDARIYF